MYKKPPFVLLLAFTVLIFIFFVSYSEYGKTEKTNENLPVHPIVDFPIQCKGDKVAEFKKRIEGSSGYHEPEVYTGLYDVKWDDKQSTQKFNVLNLEKDSKTILDKYKNKLLPGKALNFPTYERIENYLENISFRPVEIELNGRGYFFFEDGGVVTLFTQRYFKENEARLGKECFDSGKREVFPDLSGYEAVGRHPTNYSGYDSKLLFDKFAPQFCYAYSFLETTGEVFLACLSEKLSSNKVRFLILGYSYSDSPSETATSGYDAKLSLVFKDYLTVDTGESYVFNNFFNGIDIVQNKKGAFFISTPSDIYSLKKNNEGFLEMELLEKPNGINRLFISHPDPSYPSPGKYDLPYLFITGYSGRAFRGLIFDIEKGKFLDVNQDSCVITAKDEFYNDTVDPFLRGPYKSLYYEAVSESYVRVNQYSANAGCVTHEGSIDVYFEGDSVNCRIKIPGDTSC